MGFTLIYERLMRGRSDMEKLRTDARLGMPGAAAQLAEFEDDAWSAYEGAQ